MKPEASAPGGILHVDQAGNGDFLSIQHAINEAQLHDTIYIHDGLYYENIFINKSITLQGESTGKAIIDGNMEHSVINITADDVFITTLTIRHSGRGTDAGIKVDSSRHITITNCDIYSNYYGIWFFHSSNNNATQCNIHDNYDGILLHYLSTSNTVEYCQINANNNLGMQICCASRGNIIHDCDFVSNKKFGIDVSVADNRIYLNNFIDNGIDDNGLNARSKDENQWDFEKKGNYWSDYDESSEGANDTDGDGIVDSPYFIIEQDYDFYPFINQIDHGLKKGKDTPGFLFFGFLFALIIVFLTNKYR